MTFEHDGETITIKFGERTQQSLMALAVAWRAPPSRGCGAAGPNVKAAVQSLLRRLSAALVDAGSRPLSQLEEAAVLARVAEETTPSTGKCS
jgi:hypothetical protein